MGDFLQKQDESMGDAQEVQNSQSRDTDVIEESKLVIQHEFDRDQNEENQDIYE